VKLARALALLLCSVILAAGGIDELGRQCDSGESSACAKLAAIAMSRYRSTKTRIAAVGKISDSAALSKIAWQGHDPAVQLAATERITSERDLIAIASDGSGCGAMPCYRLTAAQRRAADSRLRRLALPGIQAASQITGQAALEKIASSHPNPYVRIAAIVRLTNQPRLREIFSLGQGTTDPYPRQEGITAGIRIAELVRPEIERFIALCQTGTQEACGKLAIAAKSDIDAERKVALEKITIQAVLSEVALSDSFWSDESVRALTDQRLLAQVALTAARQLAREAAVRKLTERAVLARIAESDVSPRVRQAARSRLYEAGERWSRADVEKLTDQALLARIAATADSEPPRIAAVHRLTDRAALCRIADRDTSATVRRMARLRLSELGERWDAAAVKKLTDQALLAEIAVIAADEAPRIVAVQKLTDRTVIRNIADRDDSPKVRRAARSRLKALGEKP
jgi:hypothetical protein